MSEQATTEDKYYGQDPKICFVCGKPKADAQSTFVAEMRKAGNSGGLQKTEIAVPRCASCKNIHEKGGLYFKVCAVVFLLVGMAYGNYIGDGARIMMIIYGFAFAMVGAMIWVIAKAVITSGNKKGSGDLSAHPKVAELKQQGWALNEIPDKQRFRFDK